MNSSEYLANKLIDHVFRNIVFSSPANVYVGFFSDTPTSLGGTELVGNGYARQLSTFGVPTSGVSNSTNTASFAATGGNWLQIKGVGIWDAETGGNLLSFSDVNGPLLGEGSSVDINVGDLQVSFD